MSHRWLYMGFTLVEVLAAIVVISILTTIIVAVYNGNKDAAITVRRQNAAAVLNEAEKNLSVFVTSTAPGLGIDPGELSNPPNDPTLRIGLLIKSNFLHSPVAPSDVIFDPNTLRWSAKAP